MSDSTAAEVEADDDAAGSEDDIWNRSTAPQTPFTMRQVGIGLGIAVIGVIIAFSIPILLT